MITNAPLPPKAPLVKVTSGVSYLVRKPHGCRVEYTRVSVAARMVGIKSMVTYWCPK